MADYAIKVMFPGLTADDKIYVEGSIELNPGPSLIGFAKSKETRRHGDSGRVLRLAKFIKRPELEEEFVPDEFDDFDEPIKRVPVVEDEVPEDGLDEKKRSELVDLVANLGAKKPFARTLNKPNLVKLVRVLRTF
jgi:hypothetical protein